MRVRVYRNLPRGDANRRALGRATLPGRQTLIWLGPAFILVQR